MSFILEHFRSVLTSQLIQESSSKGFSQTKEARSNVRPLADHVVATRWRPWTLHPAALLSTLLFTLGIIGILEYLQRSSNANHGIAFASSRDAFSGATTFLSLYLPTLLAVLFSMWWSWVDLDIKRLEPWYQLISLKTTKMRCSLLLQYPVEFLAWIPFRAARRRQWSVVSASLTMVLVFWAVTPLQSGIFNVASTSISRTVSVSPPARLLPLLAQAGVLGGNVLNAAYGVTWLGQALPPFTTREFALAPVAWQALESAGQNTSLLTNTTLYRAELNCFAPASVKFPTGETDGTLEVDDGEGCKQKTDITRTLSTRGSNGYQSMICDKYFIVWQRTEAPLSDVGSLATRLCQTTYYSQPVQANISVPGGKVLQTWSLGPQTALPEHEFNKTLFEFIVSKGLAPSTNTKNTTSFQQKDPRPFDISETTVLAQDFRVSQRGFPPLNSILAGIAVGGQNLTFDRLVQSPEAIDAAFRSAQKLIFALAVSTVSEPPNLSEFSHPAVLAFSIQSLQMVPVITRSVQAILGLISILITVLAALYFNKFLPFGSDPNSIAFLAALASRQNFLDHFKSLDREEDLVPRLRYRQAALRNRHGELSLSLDLVDDQRYVDPDSEASGLVRGEARQTQLRAHNVWPMELKLPVGLAFALMLSLAIAALIFLETWTRAHDGLPLPSQDTIAQQIILNYIPTVFGTLIEPFLIVVCRYLCFLQPFEDLRRGPAKASSTLVQKYTSLPPQLALVGALRTRHFRLASLSFATVLANLLTIALSGLFVIRQTTMPFDVDVVQIYSPTLNSSIIQFSKSFDIVGVQDIATNGEPFQLLLSNITAATALPAWTTKDRYYLPVNLTFAPNDSSNYGLTTTGFEGSLDCTILTESPSNFTYDFSLNSDATQIRLLTTQTLANGTKVDCFAPMSMTDDTVTLSDGNHPTTQVFVSGNPAGQNAVEMFMVPMTGPSAGDRKYTDSCRDHFLGGWVRANISLSDKLSIVNSPASTENLGLVTGPTANTTSIALEKLFLACKARTHAAKYNITVDPNGQVLNAVELPNSSFPMDESISVGAFDVVRNPFLYPLDLLTWHNDTRARDWISFFIAKIARSDSLLDPAAPLPDGMELSRQVSDVVQRLFALVLAANRNAFIELPEPVKMSGQKLTIVDRVFLSGVMYKIALAILCIDVVVILYFYLRMGKPFLARMPTSIASNVAFFAASRFAGELAEEAETHSPPEEVVRRIMNGDRKFGFGRFLGTDGGVHVGIEREPFVQPLNLAQGLRRRAKWNFWRS